MKKCLSFMAAAVLAVSMLVGCGSSAGETTVNTEAAGTEEAGAEAAGGDGAEAGYTTIKEGVLMVGTHGVL